MKSWPFRKYGAAPFKVAVVHGGPGAPGEMAPVARELAWHCGILEPLQSKNSIQGQLLELKALLETEGTPPLILVGYSWGAWLSLLLVSEYPQLVKKLILVGCPPLEEKYVSHLMKMRRERLNENERLELDDLIKNLDEPIRFRRFEELILKSDAYIPIQRHSEIMEFQANIHEQVWKEAKALRASGKLLKAATRIYCPVVAIHGDYDPHPSEGVQEPLSAVLKEFHFFLLEKCGHSPWNEQKAKEPFYALLKQEIGL